jgi:tetratricopeptide (TPR) repeat protein
MIRRILPCGAIALLFACTEKLDIKPDQSKNVPETVADFQALLDHTDVMNNNIPAFGEAGTDNYYITDTRYNSLTQESERNAYLWGGNIFPVNAIALDWAGNYTRINVCNLVLEGLEKVATGAGTSEFNNAKGSALFFRAYSFYTLAEEFSKPYDSTTAATDPGIPLRVTSDIHTLYQRASVQATYDQILADLSMAVDLLPDLTAYKTRPSKAAAYALLARIYLTLRRYEEAFHYADLSLDLYHELLDYNKVDGSGTLSFQVLNADVIFHALMSSTPLLRLNSTFIDSILYKQYDENDLRKTLFFRQGASGFIFKGSYSGDVFAQFGGIAVDELYLIRAECYARKADATHAMNDINTLLKTRWKAGTYEDMTATDPGDALEKVLIERRKELIFRGLRWSDLRRLNKDIRFAKTLTRIVNGTVYQLTPNDPRYVYPIPEDEIRLSGIQQNIR